MISLSTNNLSYSIGLKEILSDITFSVEEGDRLGVVGVNGSGKSTLLRLISGKLTADSGEIYIAKDKTVGMMEQNDAFDDGSEDDTVISRMYGAYPQLCRDEERIAEIERELLSSTGEAAIRLSAQLDRVNSRYIEGGGLHYKSRCKSILSRLGFSEETHDLSIKSLSGGQRTRLALARLLFAQPDILILDEPTNHLDTDTMVWLEEHLSAYKKTLIIVSHDRYFLDRVTNKTLDIENCRGELYKCAYSQYVQRKKEKREAEAKHYELQQKEIARLEAYIEQQRRWNRERNIIAAESREKAIARMEKLEKPKDAPRAISFAFSESGESGNDVLSVKGLKMGFGTKILFEDLSFEVKKKERVFIAGANGCGKSTLLKLLLGKLSPLSGKINFGYNVHIGYYDQENQNLDDEKTVLDELWDAYPGINQTQLRVILASFMFRGEDIEKKVKVLSGGERARLTLAKLILSKTNVLILDEPTNHLDIPSREVLENAISEFDGTVIAVSHDRYFTRRLATRILEMGCVLKDHRGGYSEYEEKKAKEAATIADFAETKTVSSGKEEYLKRKADAQKSRKEAAFRKKVLAEIEKLEKELSDINEELFGEAATDYVRAGELDRRRETVEERLMELYEEEEKFSAE
ncbi:MAG: ABC-F family ATP-binding cassette domain-containing protein [Ruminococcaceae bacterium]|nr:ABC-F family ATP-binding cassette domain-containing protein [Oscillospiraceae bacterium]